MGKQRRKRQKLHLEPTQKKDETPMDTTPTIPGLKLLQPLENPFAGIDINFSKLTKRLSDDTRSVKSFKSLKSEKGGDKPLPKKEKLKLRKEFLLQKIDTVNQMKKEMERRRKKKTVPIMGDTNPLRDALPSLESLLKSRGSYEKGRTEPAKPKGIQKAAKRKKNLVEGVKTFKKLMASGNTLEIIAEHVKANVDGNNKLVKSSYFLFSLKNLM